MRVPLIARNVFDSIRILTSACRLLADRCVSGLVANEEQLLRHAESTPAIATALNPHIGYDLGTEIVKEAVASGRTIREVALEKGVDEATLDEALDLRAMARGAGEALVHRVSRARNRDVGAPSPGYLADSMISRHSKTSLVLLLLVASVAMAGRPGHGGRPGDPRGADPAEPESARSACPSSWTTTRRHGTRGGPTRGAASAARPTSSGRSPASRRSLWFGRFTRPNFNLKVRRRIDAAKAVGQVPIFVVARAEANRCTPTYQAGGPSRAIGSRGSGTTTWRGRSATTA